MSDGPEARTVAPKINPFVGLFFAIVAVMVPLILWVDGRLNARLDRIEARQIEHGERLTALETGQASLREDVNGLEADIAGLEADVAGLEADVAGLEAGQAALRAGQAELRDDVARVEAGQNATGERMARIEGTVAGALGQPFPDRDRVALAPSPEVGEPARD